GRCRWALRRRLALPLSGHGRLRPRHSFPTRRSSDLVDMLDAATQSAGWSGLLAANGTELAIMLFVVLGVRFVVTWLSAAVEEQTDRKITRLNSSHVKISYAVFCLKKKSNQYHVDVRA